MAFNSTADITLTAGDIITEALEICGVLAEGESATTAQNTSALRTLNNIIKSLSADTQIFAQAEYRLNLVASTGTYTLDTTNVGYIPNKILNATLVNAEYYDSANLTVVYDALAVSTYSAGETVTFSGGSTGIVITDNGATSMTIRLTEGDTTPANDETMVGGTSGTTSAVNGTPSAITQTGDSNEIPIRMLSQQEWYALSDKLVEGRVTHYYPQRHVVGVGTTLNLWPVPEDTTYDLKLWLQYPYRDVDATTDDVWFTQEWYLALSFMLAHALAFKYGLPRLERDDIKVEAERFLELAETYDTDGSVFLHPSNKNG